MAALGLTCSVQAYLPLGVWNLGSLISVWSSLLALQAAFLTPGAQGSPDVALNFMELICWWRIRICQMVEINILIVKSVTDVLHVSYRLSPTWGVWHCLPSILLKKFSNYIHFWSVNTEAERLSKCKAHNITLVFHSFGANYNDQHIIYELTLLPVGRNAEWISSFRNQFGSVLES